MQTPFTTLRARVAPLERSRALGRIAAIEGGRLHVTGLDGLVRMGDELRCRADGPGHGSGFGSGPGLLAEVVALGPRVVARPCGSADGLVTGLTVERRGPPSLAPCAAWLGRVVDPFGQPLDGRPLPQGPARPLRPAPPDAVGRGGFGTRLRTGIVALDTLLPLAEGQRVGLFAGSGVGKSRLLATLAAEVEADVLVAALVGERGREVSAFAREVLAARPGVVVAATSDRPANVRLRALPAALAVAESFRDAGARVLLVCDSLTRHAEAFAALAGADAPAGLAADLAACLERAGPGVDGAPAITLVATVLVAGADMEGPVADTARGLLDGHVVLSREIAEAGRYPAIDPLASVSRALPEAASAAENEVIARARAVLERHARHALLIASGLHEAGRDPAVDEAVRLAPAIEAALAEAAPDVPAAFARLEAALAGR